MSKYLHNLILMKCDEKLCIFFIKVIQIFQREYINPLNAVPDIYGHIKLPVIAATIYIYALDKFVHFPREAKRLNEFRG